MGRGSAGRVLSRMFERRVEWANGRIDTTSGNWVWPHQVPPGYSGPEQRGKTADGRDMACIIQKGVLCPCPDVGQPYPQSDTSGNYFVPERVCRKCEYRRKAQRGRRYPWCAWAKEQRGGVAGALKELSDVIRQAKSDAEQIIEGGTDHG